MIPLTNKEIKSYEKQKVCYICGKKFGDDKNEKSKYDLYHKVRDHCHFTGKFRGAAHNICNLRYKVLKNISVVFNNGSTYDYHFVVKNAWKEKKLGWIANLLDLKMIGWLIDAKNVKNHTQS